MQLKNQKLSLLFISSFVFIPCFAMEEKPGIHSGCEVRSIKKQTLIQPSSNPENEINLDLATIDISHVHVATTNQPPSKPAGREKLPEIIRAQGIKPKDSPCSLTPTTNRPPSKPPARNLPELESPVIGTIRPVSCDVNGQTFDISKYTINRDIIDATCGSNMAVDVMTYDKFRIVKKAFEENINTLKRANRALELNNNQLKAKACSNLSDHGEIGALRTQVKELARIKKIGGYLLSGTIAASFGATLFTIIAKNPNRLLNPLGFTTNHSAPIIAAGFATIGVSSYALGRYLGIFGAKK